MTKYLHGATKGPPLLKRLSAEGEDSLWAVLRAGRPYYPGCRVLLLAATSSGVIVHKVL